MEQEFSFSPKTLDNDLRMELALKYRKIYLNDVVDTNSIFDIIFVLQKIVETDKISGTKEPITLYIDTDGGVCSEGFILVDTIIRLKNQGYKFRTVVIGTAYSFGLILAVVGSERYCYKHSDYMYHMVRLQPPDGSLESQKRILHKTEKIDSSLKQVLLENTKLTIEQLQDIDSKCIDWFFDAEEAIKYGVCDKILE